LIAFAVSGVLAAILLKQRPALTDYKSFAAVLFAAFLNVALLGCPQHVQMNNNSGRYYYVPIIVIFTSFSSCLATIYMKALPAISRRIAAFSMVALVAAFEAAGPPSSPRLVSYTIGIDVSARAAAGTQFSSRHKLLALVPVKESDYEWLACTHNA
jgi:hypothetical protein